MHDPSAWPRPTRRRLTRRRLTRPRGLRLTIGSPLRRLVGAAAVVIAFTTSGVVDAAPCWPAPVAGTVIDPFRAPACPWCAGNRGIEYDVGPGTRPRAVAPGIVSFSGVVAGERYVVVDLPNGWKLTYGRLVESHLHRGDPVIVGSIVGSASGSFYFGLRIDGVPIDPAPYLGVARGVPRLIPVDGRAARLSPGTRLVCPVGVSSPSR